MKPKKPVLVQELVKGQETHRIRTMKWEHLGRKFVFSLAFANSAWAAYERTMVP